MILAIAARSNSIDLYHFVTIPEDKFKPLKNMVTFFGTYDWSISCIVIAFSAAHGELLVGIIIPDTLVRQYMPYVLRESDWIAMSDRDN